MDKEFWQAVKENEFGFPAGHNLQALTEELFSYLGSTDPELRDTIGLEAFYHWLDQGLYSPAEVRALIPRLVANLQEGLGDAVSDTVFRRSFSNLWLALIIEQDLKKPLLTRDELVPILEAALQYLPGERDLRGLVPVKGWAHAIAHCADLLGALSRHPHTQAGDHLRVLDCIADFLQETRDWIALFGEDGRLARVAIAVFIRATLSMEQVGAWLERVSADWKGAWFDEGRTHAFFNARNFLRAIHWRIQLLRVDKVPRQEEILKMVEDTLEGARPWEQEDFAQSLEPS